MKFSKSDLSEAQISAAIEKALVGRRDLRLWRASVGPVRDKDGNIVATAGQPGQADFSGIRLPGGQRLEIEVKTRKGRQSEQQRRWQRMILKFGGVYILARSVDDVLAVLGPGPGATP